MIVIGMTGGIGSGKSTVSKTFIAEGFPVIDADHVSRAVVTTNSIGLNAIIDCFGKQFLKEDLTLDRTKLGKYVFANPKELSKLNKIMKPLINQEMELQFLRLWAEGHKMIVWDASITIENGNADKYRPLIVVHCRKEQQLERVMKRNCLTEEEAMFRINAQLPTETKIKLADYLIDTSGSIDESIIQTKNIINKLKEML